MAVTIQEILMAKTPAGYYKPVPSALWPQTGILVPKDIYAGSPWNNYHVSTMADRILSKTTPKKLAKKLRHKLRMDLRRGKVNMQGEDPINIMRALKGW